MPKSKLSIILLISAAMLAFLVILYYVKDRVGINILPHRHMLFFKE